MSIPRRRRPLFRLAGAFGLAIGIVVLVAAPASAHATLLSESPAQYSTVATSPTQVELTYDENVEISFGSIALYNQKGDRVDIGAPHHSAKSDHSIEASVPHLADGAYVLTWRVISADSHPVHGAYTFTVGSSSVNAQGLAAKLEAEGGGNRTVGVVFGIVRAAEFAGIALLLGAVVFAAAIRPRGRRRSRADSLVWAGWILLFVATVAGLLLQGPYAGGFPITATFHSAVVRAVLQTRYGHLIEIRLVLLIAALPLLFAARKFWRPGWWWWTLAVPVGVAIAATPGLAGHAATGTFTELAVPLDTLHVAAMSVWLGGLAALAFVVLDRDPDARRASERFSPVALCSVVLIVVSGVFAAWRQVGWSVDAFRDTTYGRLLLVKVAVFIGLIALAAWSRAIVRRRRPATLSAAIAPPATATRQPGTMPVDPDVRGLRWSVGAELVFGIAILVITSLLVNAQPARSALTLPYSTEFRSPTMLIDLIISPAKAGRVDIHIYTLSPAGGNLFTPSVTAEISLPSKGIAPLTVPLVRAGPNHFLACLSPASESTGTATCTNKFSIPFSGRWLIVIRALRDEFDEVAVQKSVDIR
ncbi:MAG: copper resistance CopC/CopD family protein [Acidimicrobiia bacterium]